MRVCVTVRARAISRVCFDVCAYVCMTIILLSWYFDVAWWSQRTVDILYSKRRYKKTCSKTPIIQAKRIVCMTCIAIPHVQYSQPYITIRMKVFRNRHGCSAGQSERQQTVQLTRIIADGVYGDCHK